MTKRILIRVAVILVALLALNPPEAHATLLAPKGTCHNARNADASHRAKRHALRCLLKYARAHAGRTAIAGSRTLHYGAVHKGMAINKCGFSHTACGYPLGYWDKHAGWCRAGSSWRVGENLARGYTTARSVVKAWLASPEHRANILGRWGSVGTAIRNGVWIAHYGACTG